MDRPNERVDVKMPRDLEAEKSVLACLMYDPTQVDVAIEQLKADDFFSIQHREVFAAIQRLSVKGSAIGMLSIMDELKTAGQLESVGGMPFLSDLATYEHGLALFDVALDMVKNKSVQRDLIAAAQSIVQEGVSERMSVPELLAYSEEKITELTSDKWKPSYSTIEAVVKQAYEQTKLRLTDHSLAFGVTTGFKGLDEKTYGLQKGNLIILAARPGLGKTALALNMATNAAKAGHWVVIFSLEMSKDELAYRVLSSEAELDGYKLRTGKIDKDELHRFVETCRNVAALPMIIDDTPAISITELRARSRRLKREGRCGFIIVDYLQLVRSSPGIESREQQIADISRSLKALAKELEVPVLALSQLNRSVENRKPPKPMLSDLRESGSIEQDADIIMFIYREGKYDENANQNKAEIIIGKQRSGATGSVELVFIAETTKFAEKAYEDNIGSF